MEKSFILLAVIMFMTDSITTQETASPGQCTYSLSQILELHKDKDYAQLQKDYAELKEDMSLMKTQMKRLMGQDNTCSVNDRENTGFPQDCTEVFESGNRTTGVYYIQPEGSAQPFKAFCELAYEGWTVFQRHHDGTTDFQRTWDEYKEGFGDLEGDHWLGNDKIHLLTSQGSYIMRIELPMANKRLIIGEYEGFMVESESSLYTLNLGTSLIAGLPGRDSVLYHNKMYFSTWDNDNDKHATNCALTIKGGWWYNACHHISVNGFQHTCGSTMCGYWYTNYLIEGSVLKLKRKM